MVASHFIEKKTLQRGKQVVTGPSCVTSMFDLGQAPGNCITKRPKTANQRHHRPDPFFRSEEERPITAQGLLFLRTFLFSACRYRRFRKLAFWDWVRPVSRKVKACLFVHSMNVKLATKFVKGQPEGKSISEGSKFDSGKSTTAQMFRNI